MSARTTGESAASHVCTIGCGAKTVSESGSVAERPAAVFFLPSTPRHDARRHARLRRRHRFPDWVSRSTIGKHHSYLIGIEIHGAEGCLMIAIVILVSAGQTNSGQHCGASYTNMRQGSQQNKRIKQRRRSRI